MQNINIVIKVIVIRQGTINELTSIKPSVPQVENNRTKNHY